LGKGRCTTGLFSGRKIFRPDVIHSSIHGAQLGGQVAAHDAETFLAGNGVDVGLIGMDIVECDVVTALGQFVGIVAADPARAGDENFNFVGSLSDDFNSLEAPVQSQ